MKIRRLSQQVIHATAADRLLKKEENAGYLYFNPSVNRKVSGTGKFGKTC
jgi:hypothetical protein